MINGRNESVPDDTELQAAFRTVCREIRQIFLNGRRTDTDWNGYRLQFEYHR
ncbi:hypothetical protein CLOM621_05791 [Clostridium sp. M62/1]|nr:hypothetical protein CLOM621_05791 [Clostridium sp. M62/1]